MNLQNLVLSKDLRLATNLYECCYSCLNRARMEFYRDNLDEAERWVKEFERCKRDLDELIKRKKDMISSFSWWKR
jgi:Holliday junction resolvase RusA-like endonuclease